MARSWGRGLYLVQDETARISPYFWELVVELMLIATVLFLEGGLLDLGRVGQRLFQRLAVVRMPDECPTRPLGPWPV